MMVTIAQVTGSARAPLSERGDDLYQTPPEAVHALLRVERLPSIIWEPACGPGAIVRILRSMLGIRAGDRPGRLCFSRTRTPMVGIS